MWTLRKSKRALEIFLVYSARHKHWLFRGILATVAVVVLRLLMPWPLRGVLETVLPNASSQAIPNYLPSWGDPVLWLVLAYLLVVLALGWAQMAQRINLRRFAARSVHDMRAAVVQNIQADSCPGTSTGDLLARVIGDSARIKAGLTGIMVHGLQNTLLFTGICVVMLCVSVPLGLVFCFSAILALGIGLTSARLVAQNANKQRRKEGRYATAVEQWVQIGAMEVKCQKINRSSLTRDLRTTRLIARTTMVIHIVMGWAVAGALLTGTHCVRAGQMAPGELFLFIAYALTMHRRMVQMGRQSARAGKVMACLERLGILVAPKTKARPCAPVILPELTSDLRLVKVRLKASSGSGRPARLRRIDLVITAHSRVAVVGKPGAGKSSLLQLLAGRLRPDKGKIFWNQVPLDHQTQLAAAVAYLPQVPVLAPVMIWQLLGLNGPGKLPLKQAQSLQRLGLRKVLQRFPANLACQVSSPTLSHSEARLFLLARLVRSEKVLWVLDEPLTSFSRPKSYQCLSEIFSRAATRTVVVALAKPVHLELFDYLVVMHHGKIAFQGPPAQWPAKGAGVQPVRTEKHEFEINPEVG